MNQGHIRYKEFFDALKYNRKLLISPTASGKSLMIYAVVRYYAEKIKDTFSCSNYISS